MKPGRSTRAICSWLLAWEDQRFREHPGVDPFAMLRAAYQMAVKARVVSGASTITMQVARLLEPRERTLGAKFLQMARALQLDCTSRKDEMLELYLTLAPYRRQPRRRAGRKPRLVRQGAAATSPSARRRCWSRCRNRPSAAAPTASRPTPRPRATA